MRSKNPPLPELNWSSCTQLLTSLGLRCRLCWGRGCPLGARLPLTDESKPGGQEEQRAGGFLRRCFIIAR